uniref:Uncharacterized protein n=1 Tax=Anguilla anguilla TaxID=7936 RepID=A0A0E9QE65_ANGAN
MAVVPEIAGNQEWAVKLKIWGQLRTNAQKTAPLKLKMGTQLTRVRRPMRGI